MENTPQCYNETKKPSAYRVKLVMLVKLAFVMQRLKKYLKKFCHDQQRWEGGQFLDFMEGTAVMRGDIELMGGPPVSPLGKTLPGLTSFLNYTLFSFSIRNLGRAPVLNVS